MAEINGRGATEVAAGRKVLFDSQAQTSVAVCEMPTTWSASNGDTVATGIFLKKGSRLLGNVVASFGTGTASSTLSVGIRNRTTLTAVAAGGIVNGLAITTAATAAVNTGTLLITGQRYVLVEDCEIYFTFGGANPTANQAIRVEVPYIGP